MPVPSLDKERGTVMQLYGKTLLHFSITDSEKNKFLQFTADINPMIGLGLS